MEYFELNKKRHSYRGNYTSKKTSVQDIKLILSAALSAPTGMNAQSTQFVVVDEEDKINQISDILGKKNVAGASAIILCIINKIPKSVTGDLNFEIEDCSAAVMSMLLAITDLGYASVWIDGLLRRDNIASKIAKIIDLPDDKLIQVLLPVGEAAEQGEQPPKKAENERVSFNKYSL